MAENDAKSLGREISKSDELKFDPNSMEEARRLSAEIKKKQSNKEYMVQSTWNENVLMSLDDMDFEPGKEFRESSMDEIGIIPKVGNQLRDTLSILSVTEVVDFTHGVNVTMWRTLHLGDMDIVIGMAPRQLILMNEIDGNFELKHEIPFDTDLITMEAMVMYDSESQGAVGIVVLSTEDYLTWFEIRDNFDRLNQIWMWNIHITSTSIKYIRTKDLDALILVANHNNVFNSTSSVVYEFNLESQQFWLMQKLNLDGPSKNFAVLNTGNEFIVAYPQEDVAVIYQLKIMEHYHCKFTHLANFTSKDLHLVTAFQMGGHSYIAISGRSGQILRYTNGKFIPEMVLTETFEMVEAYFPVPARTFRDDLIIFVQHKIEFTTHNLSVLDALIWNGEAFDFEVDIPCYVNDIVSNFGIGCILDRERPDGFRGSTVIQRGDIVSLIVPRSNAHSSLFNVNFELISRENPIKIKIEEIRQTMDVVNKLIEYQRSIIDEAIQIMNRSLQTGLQENIVDSWEIDRLETPVLYEKPNFDYKEMKISDGPLWVREDNNVNVPQLEQTLAEDEMKLSELENQLKNAIGADLDNSDWGETNAPVTVKGKLSVDGTLEAEELFTKKFENDDSVHFRGKRHAEISRRVLDVASINIQHLNFKEINGIPADELTFNAFDQIHLNGPLEFDGIPVEIENVILPENGTVNDIDLNENLVFFSKEGRYPSTLSFETLNILDDIKVKETINNVNFDFGKISPPMSRAAEVTEDNVITTEKLSIDGPVYVNQINGVPWIDFIGRIILKDVPMRLDLVEVDGVSRNFLAIGDTSQT